MITTDDANIRAALCTSMGEKTTMLYLSLIKTIFI